MYADTTFATLYNPAEFTPEQLIDRFVVRLKIFERLYKDIQTSDMKTPEQHYLIHGRRGMGKTTLLLRLAYEIEKDPVLNTWMLPVVYNEEEHSINRLSRFWERAAQILADKHLEFSSLPDEMDALHAQHSGRENDFEEAVFNLLINRLRPNKYKIVLFVDNFGTLFRSFNDRENRRLRTVLQTCPDIRIIGATPTVLGEIYDVKHPFYEFFKVERLSGLDKDETRDLLLKIGEVTGNIEAIKDILAHQPGRVETLRRFTSGVIRTMVLLFDVFTDDHKGDAFHDLEVIIDRTTPLYQHRMDDLSSNQKPIVEAIALAWDAISTKEIAARTRMESKVVSAQLSQLVENEVVDLIQTNTKNHLYQVSERFFNIWYLMRFGRRDARHRVKWLIRFLESWCTPSALEERTLRHIEALQAGTFHIEGAYLLSEALAATKYTPRWLQHDVLKATARFLEGKSPILAKKLSKSDRDLLNEARNLIKTGDYSKAENLVKKMISPDFVALGAAYKDIGEYDKSIEFYIKEGSKDAICWAGIISIKYLKDYYKAEDYLLLALKQGANLAPILLGILFHQHLKDYNKAETYYRIAKEKGEIEGDNSLAYLFCVQNKNQDEALELANKLSSQQNIPSYHAHTAACVYLWTGEIEKALMLCEKFMFDERLLEDDYHEYIHFLILLLVREQYDFLYQYFTSEALVGDKKTKDRFKPVWYALMYYQREKHPAEYLRMGEELRETVAEIIQKVESVRNLWKKASEKS